MAFRKGLMDERYIGPFCMCMKEEELKNGFNERYIYGEWGRATSL